MDVTTSVDMEKIFYLYMLLLGGIVAGNAHGGCLYGEEEDCIFKCHCFNEMECGGSCPSGCQQAALGYNWTGPACQIGNVAFGKPAQQYPAYRTNGADSAVDGRLPTSTRSDIQYCAFQRANYGRWSVDLGTLHKIYNVTIYFRLNRRCCPQLDSNFVIKVTNSTGNGSVCAVRNDTVYDMDITLSCTTPLIGNVVEFIRKPGSYQQHLSVLCEVIVIGHKYIDCSLCPSGETCSDVTGCARCLGSYQPDCKQECEDGYYGVNCEKECGSCSGNTSCDKVSGVCASGCQMWWATGKCNHYIYKVSHQNETITVADVTPSSLTVTWPGLNVSQQLVNYYGYDVKCKEVVNGSESLFVKRVGHRAEDIRVTIDQLNHSTVYFIEVTPFRLWGMVVEYGEPYPTISAQTLAGYESSKSAVIIPVIVVCLLLVLGITVAVVYILCKRKRKHFRSFSEHSQALRRIFTLKKRGISNIEEPQKNDEDQKHSEIAIMKSANENRKPKEKMVTSRRPVNSITEDQEEEHVNTSLDHVYFNTMSQHDRPKPVAVEDFEAYVKDRKSDMNAFMAEFMSLPSEEKSKCLTGQRSVNSKKNRFHNIFPYEQTRVKLQVNSHEKESDYINASYIKGFNKEKEYIATQGPNNITVTDFWQMVWQEEANRIVMLANLKENGKSRCYQYWPEDVGDTITEGLFTIRNEGIDVTADYTTRILILKRGDETRRITQFHFVTWEDKNKPLYGIVTLLAFYRKIHASDNTSRGPMIVHCSAGVGRTGTFIALDILQQQAAKDKFVDVYQCVTRLRNERMNMVQTMEQYILIHNVLLEQIKCGQTSYSCNGFKEVFHRMTEGGSKQGASTELERQFQLLSEMNETKDKAKRYNKGQKLDKNRNTILIDSFRAHDFYIVTQTPSSATVNEFWSLVFYQKSHSIVMLNSAGNIDEPYWPRDEMTVNEYGPIEVTLLESRRNETSDSIIMRDLIVKHKKQRENTLKVRQFQLLSWPVVDHLPPKSEDIIKLLLMLDEWQRSNNLLNQGKTIVHCLTGVEQSGIFCGISYILDKLRAEQQVDAFLAVRCVTRNYPKFFQLQDEYKLLYEMCVRYMEQYSTYVNFE